MRLTMVGRIADCALLSYRTPAESVAPLLSPGLEIDLHDGWAYWNIVACTVEAMRPRGVPRALGMTYRHVAYRLYVRARLLDGREVTGLQFVRSDADGRLVAAMGNRMTDFRFHVAPIALAVRGGEVALDVGGSAPAVLRARATDEPAPPSFLRYAPLGLSTDARGARLRIAAVERDERRWRERRLEVAEARWSLFEALGQREAALVRATWVDPIDYVWRIGGREALAAPGRRAAAAPPP